MNQKRRFGWIPDYPDFRDHTFSGFGVGLTPVSLPTVVDHRDHDTPIYNQGDLGSCTANAIGALYDFVTIKQGESLVTPSRLFIYYLEREIEGTVDYDNGAMIRTGMKVISKFGAAPELYWPYDISKFRERPSPRAFTKALRHQALVYERVPRDLNLMRRLLANGLPFVFGFIVYDSFYQADPGGVVPIPKQGDRMVGGHAVMAVGYDDNNQHFIVRNSWGADWGVGGYFYLPYMFLSERRLSMDFWTIRTTEG